MARVRGVILRASTAHKLNIPADIMRRLSESLVDNLVELHALDIQPNLIQLGKPDGYVRRQVEGWQKRYDLTYNDLRLVGSGERLTKETFAKYRALHKLAAVPEGTLPLENTVDLALKKDFCMIGSDGGIEYEPRANSHPRGAGCFATSIRHGLDIGMPMEKILEKITTLPRSIILPALNDRGILRDVAWADLTVFDQSQINAKATVENPNQFSDGIEMVIVNGKIAYQNRIPGATAGIGIRY